MTSLTNILKEGYRYFFRITGRHKRKIVDFDDSTDLDITMIEWIYTNGRITTANF